MTVRGRARLPARSSAPSARKTCATRPSPDGLVTGRRVPASAKEDAPLLAGDERGVEHQQSEVEAKIRRELAATILERLNPRPKTPHHLATVDNRAWLRVVQGAGERMDVLRQHLASASHPRAAG
jgi:hypothetical protein